MNILTNGKSSFSLLLAVAPWMFSASLNNGFLSIWGPLTQTALTNGSKPKNVFKQASLRLSAKYWSLGSAHGRGRGSGLSTNGSSFRRTRPGLSFSCFSTSKKHTPVSAGTPFGSCYRVPADFIEVCHDLHDHTTYVAGVQDGLAEPYQLTHGFSEGCPSSPVLFNMYHSAVRRLHREQAQEVMSKLGMSLLPPETLSPINPIRNFQP